MVNAVLRDFGICGKDRQPLGLCLGDEHAVERVLVVLWQCAGLRAVEEGYRQVVEPFLLDKAVEILVLDA